jgi:hypothetical protein
MFLIFSITVLIVGTSLILRARALESRRVAVRIKR